MSVRIGSQGWEESAKAGKVLSFSVNVYFDDECQRYWGESLDLDGLIVEADSVQEFHKEAKLGAASLLEFKLGLRPKAEVTFVHAFENRQQPQVVEYA